MRNSLLIIVMLLVMAGVVVSPAKAAPAFTLPADGYFLAADKQNILQVWKLPADGTPSAIITHADKSIVDFTLSPDGKRIAYSSGMHLWFDKLDGTAPTMIDELYTQPTYTPFPAYPVFNEDGTVLAYAKNGLWIVTLDGSKPRKIADDKPVGDSPSSMRVYIPTDFIGSKYLLLTIGLWEGITVGVVDLQSGKLQELEPGLHTQFLVLSGGNILVYGNNVQGGDENIQSLSDLADISKRETLLSLQKIDKYESMWVEQVVETAPGKLRILGTGITQPDFQTIYLDFDLPSRKIVEKSLKVLPEPDQNTQQQIGRGPMSPDGKILMEYLNVSLETSLDSRGMVSGQLSFLNLEDGSIFTPTVTVPSPVLSFTWFRARKA